MTDVTFVRRRGLGYSSVAGLIACLSDLGVSADTWRSDKPFNHGDSTYYFRWGCTATIPQHGKVINNAAGIHRVCDKVGFLSELYSYSVPDYPDPQGSGYLTLPGYLPFGVNSWPISFPVVVRPFSHAQGKDFHLFNNETELADSDLSYHIFSGNGKVVEDYYWRPFIQKEKEYRVWVFCGKITCIAEKVPEDKSTPAWNHSLGASFVNTKWGDWNPQLCDVALYAADKSGLQYVAIDVMMGQDGNFYFLEANSAGSVWLNSDGEPSYRHRCIAKAIAWHVKKGSFSDIPETYEENWRKYIHPAIWENHNDHQV